MIRILADNCSAFYAMPQNQGQTIQYLYTVSLEDQMLIECLIDHSTCEVTYRCAHLNPKLEYGFELWNGIIPKTDDNWMICSLI